MSARLWFGFGMGILIGNLLQMAPVKAITPSTAKVWVVQDNDSQGYKVYQKAFDQLSLDAPTRKLILQTNQKIDQEHLGKYVLLRLVIKQGQVYKLLFQNEYGDIRASRVFEGKVDAECSLLLSANAGLGWCSEK